MIGRREDHKLDQFQNKEDIRLETVKRTSGQVKRMRNDPHVRQSAKFNKFSINAHIFDNSNH